MGPSAPRSPFVLAIALDNQSLNKVWERGVLFLVRVPGQVLRRDVAQPCGWRSTASIRAIRESPASRIFRSHVIT